MSENAGGYKYPDPSAWPLLEAKPTTAAVGEHTGLAVGYYTVHVATPCNLPSSYHAECTDIIEALDLSFAEGNIFKAIWRRAAMRQGKIKKGMNTLYDAEKIKFFADVVLKKEENASRNNTPNPTKPL